MGFLALIQIIKGKYDTAVFLITGSVILDGFDGTVARLTKTESNFGVQLDSLVDAVVFGAVTAVMIYKWGYQGEFNQLGKVMGFIFLSAGIIRLARFNVLKEAESFVANVFIGLPIPLGALSVASVIFLRGKLMDKSEVILYSIFVGLVAFLMISSIKYRTMKRLSSKNNLVILFSLAIGIALLINFPTYTIPSASFLYLISPIFYFFIDKLKKKGAPQEPLSEDDNDLEQSGCEDNDNEDNEDNEDNTEETEDPEDAEDTEDAEILDDDDPYEPEES